MFLVDKKVLQLVKSAQIGTIMRSDHMPVSSVLLDDPKLPQILWHSETGDQRILCVSYRHYLRLRYVVQSP